MKRIKIPACAILLAISAAACGEKESYREPVAVEVNVAPLNAYLMETRAGKGPMNSWFNTEVYMAYGESAAAGGSFDGFTSAKKGLVVLGKTSFQPQLFYPVNDKTIFLKGFHPREGITNIDADLELPADGKIHYTITGHEDIMVSNMVSGSAANTLKAQYAVDQPGATLMYDHLLTQLSFRMRCEAGFPSAMRVKYIRVKNVRVNAVLDLDPTIPYDESLTFSETPKTDLVAYENAAGLQLATSFSAETGNIMFSPGEKFSIEVEFTGGDKVTVTEISKYGTDISDGETERGLHYVVSLTFKLATMLPSVQAAWNEENTGGEQGWW